MALHHCPSVSWARKISGSIVRRPLVAKILQDTYHRLNTKARKYEPLAPEERFKWEAYYVADQEELSHLLRGLQVID